MKFYSIRGGVHPNYRKDLTSERPIVAMPLPERLFIPLQQHIGAPAEALVEAGDRVRKGQLIARSQGVVSAPKHAPTSGVIEAVSPLTAPHPSGLAQATIILVPDGKDEWASLPDPIAEPFDALPAAICERVAQAGIVGLGGAAFPSAVKLGLGRQHRLEILLINGAECEPYLTCDDRLMRERAKEIIDGARLMAHALGVPRVIVAVEANKPQAIESMTRAAEHFAEVSVIAVPVQYPTGSAHHLVLALTGRETPAAKRTADVGVVVHNVATARAVQQAIRHGRPLTHRVVTVSGGAMRAPNNIEAPIGAPVGSLVDFCGGFSTPPRRLVNGGPMMGEPLASLDVPVVKGTTGILALTAEEVGEQPASPCIRCGSCISVCPCGLSPVELAALIRRDRIDVAGKLGVMDCMACGSCAWACPSHLPLVQYFNYAKGRLNAEALAQRKIERTRTLVEAHNLRQEKAVAASQAVAAARKTSQPRLQATEVVE
ncbi:electron transport complex subunit RsxC [Aromatoleum buckelii]|uniref:Ion-translocating oxidoreductase complex subunit C n=1 Tax=Aromatoleum buckelii TaxID=200254 RepID=A0ABX1N369_9RHOO|nr:electron transport complex subunit RsxC [Aromatoleum buckelii]MCK0513152.1 electron transport complex subunit RsxC [Aromatoleum buckelii]